jgi:hypothetical protein
LKECFNNTKFVNCKNWFDQDEDVNKNIINKDNRNYIDYGDGVKHDEIGIVYYKYTTIGTFERYVLDNNAFDDCLDNYTDYVSKITQTDLGKGELLWYNHDLYQDLAYYGNIKDGDMPFNPTNEVNTIQQTYCCLPPDILYGCSSTAEIDGIFANSNIIGVIPRNLTKNVKSCVISNIFRNVNIMPNIEYYYDKNGSLDSILDAIVDTVDINNSNDIISERYCVIFRDEYGRLKKRKPINSDRNLGQFVYVPANFTTSGNLMNAFNFRYNLPKNWSMPSKFTKQDNTTVESYKSTYDFNNAIRTGELDTKNLIYHSQYYFTTDKSAKWEKIYDAKNLFISSEEDIDFSNINTMGHIRDFCDYNKEEDLYEKNTWTVDTRVSKYSEWLNSDNKIIENFYIDLNLCGKKNEYNMIEDNGCPIVIKNKDIKLDNFVSGILTIFLNGRVFDDTFVVNELISSLHKTNSSSYIIGYYGFGKNIILPKFNGSPIDDKIVFIPIENSSRYLDFMVDNDDLSMGNYYEYFAKGNLNRNYLFETDYNKYTFK